MQNTGMSEKISDELSTRISETSTKYPWLIVLLSAFFLFYKYVMQVYPSIMTNQLMRTFHVNATGLGNLAASLFYAYLVTQLFVGVLLDRFSTRVLSTLAIAAGAIGTFLFASTHSLTVAILSRSLIGCGVAFATVSYMKLTANWFKPRKFAFVAGLLPTAVMLGAIFGEAPLAWIVQHQGWRQSLMYCGWVGIAVAVVYFLTVRNEPQTRLRNAYKTEKHAINFSTMLSILSKGQNWILTFYSGLTFAPVAVFGGLWGTPFISENYHLTTTGAASLISIIWIGLGTGGPILGHLSGQLRNRHPLMATSLAVSLISLSLVIYVSVMPMWLVETLLFLFGFGTGAFMLGFAIGKESNPIALAATIIALINSGDAIFGAFSEPLVGKFLDLGWQGKVVHGVHYFGIANFHKAFLVLPIYLLIAFMLVFLIRETDTTRPSS